LVPARHAAIGGEILQQVVAVQQMSTIRRFVVNPLELSQSEDVSQVQDEALTEAAACCVLAA